MGVALAFYHSLALDLIADIRAGSIAPGEPVPSMRTLIRRGYVAKCSGRYYRPMAMITAQRARWIVDRSGLVMVNTPHSGKNTLVLPREEWSETLTVG